MQQENDIVIQPDDLNNLRNLMANAQQTKKKSGAFRDLMTPIYSLVNALGNARLVMPSLEEFENTMLNVRKGIIGMKNKINMDLIQFAVKRVSEFTAYDVTLYSTFFKLGAIKFYDTPTYKYLVETEKKEPTEADIAYNKHIWGRMRSTFNISDLVGKALIDLRTTTANHPLIINFNEIVDLACTRCELLNGVVNLLLGFGAPENKPILILTKYLMETVHFNVDIALKNSSKNRRTFRNAPNATRQMLFANAVKYQLLQHGQLGNFISKYTTKVTSTSYALTQITMSKSKYMRSNFFTSIMYCLMPVHTVTAEFSNNNVMIKIMDDLIPAIAFATEGSHIITSSKPPALSLKSLEFLPVFNKTLVKSLSFSYGSYVKLSYENPVVLFDAFMYDIMKYNLSQGNNNPYESMPFNITWDFQTNFSHNENECRDNCKFEVYMDHMLSLANSANKFNLVDLARLHKYHALQPKQQGLSDAASFVNNVKIFLAKPMRIIRTVSAFVAFSLSRKQASDEQILEAIWNTNGFVSEEAKKKFNLTAILFKTYLNPERVQYTPIFCSNPNYSFDIIPINGKIPVAYNYYTSLHPPTADYDKKILFFEKGGELEDLKKKLISSFQTPVMAFFTSEDIQGKIYDVKVEDSKSKKKKKYLILKANKRIQQIKTPENIYDQSNDYHVLNGFEEEEIGQFKYVRPETFDGINADIDELYGRIDEIINNTSMNIISKLRGLFSSSYAMEPGVKATVIDIFNYGFDLMSGFAESEMSQNAIDFPRFTGIYGGLLLNTEINSGQTDGSLFINYIKSIWETDDFKNHAKLIAAGKRASDKNLVK